MIRTQIILKSYTYITKLKKMTLTVLYKVRVIHFSANISVGQTCRNSTFEKLLLYLDPEEKNPLPRRLYATIPIPSFLENN